jgi:uncharacterized glyoxalase superfamily protein PhnB
MPESSTKLIPHITCRNANEAVEFYQKAFGAKSLGVHQGPDGKVMHAALDIDGATMYITDEFPDWGALGPQSIGGSPVTLHLQVSDCDAVYNRAVEAGCEAKMPPQDMFWGDRYAQVVDPYGHRWSVATTIREVSPEELQQAMASMPDCQ